MNPEIEQAFRDWLSGRAYIDGNRNYHVRGETDCAYRFPRGPIAGWNKTVKRRFTDALAFHQAAHQWQDEWQLRRAVPEQTP